jgi:hypothetical protein
MCETTERDSPQVVTSKDPCGFYIMANIAFKPYCQLVIPPNKEINIAIEYIPTNNFNLKSLEYAEKEIASR